MAKKIGKKRANQNVPKGHWHMSHKAAQEKWQKKKHQENQAKLGIYPHHPLFYPKKADKIRAVVDVTF